MRTQKQTNQTTSIISDDLRAKMDDMAFKARSEYGKLIMQMEGLIADEETTNDVVTSILSLLEIGQDNLHPHQYNSIITMLGLLNSVKHLQYMQAMSGSKKLIYD